MSGYRNPIAGKAGVLARDNLQSSNFVANTSGWKISRDGNFDVNALTAYGDVTVTVPYYDGSTFVASLAQLMSNLLNNAIQYAVNQLAYTTTTTETVLPDLEPIVIQAHHSSAPSFSDYTPFLFLYTIDAGANGAAPGRCVGTVKVDGVSFDTQAVAGPSASAERNTITSVNFAVLSNNVSHTVQVCAKHTGAVTYNIGILHTVLASIPIARFPGAPVG